MSNNQSRKLINFFAFQLTQWLLDNPGDLINDKELADIKTNFDMKVSGRGSFSEFEAIEEVPSNLTDFVKSCRAQIETLFPEKTSTGRAGRSKQEGALMRELAYEKSKLAKTLEGIDAWFEEFPLPPADAETGVINAPSWHRNIAAQLTKRKENLSTATTSSEDVIAKLKAKLAESNASVTFTKNTAANPLAALQTKKEEAPEGNGKVATPKINLPKPGAKTVKTEKV